MLINLAFHVRRVNVRHEKMWADAKAAFKEMIEMIPISKNTGWKKHSQVHA